MSAEDAEQAGLPCLAGKCAADNARTRLASGVALRPAERADLELDALGCKGPQADPWDPSLMWDGCPAKAAYKRADIDAALTVKGLMAMGFSLSPRECAAHVVDTLAMIEGEKNALRAEARNG